MRACKRIVAVLGVLVLSILTCAATFALLDRAHLRLGSAWDWAPAIAMALALGGGLTVVFARARMRWWAAGLAAVLCLLVAFVAYAFMGLAYSCKHGDCL